MILHINTVARDGKLYDAKAIYSDGLVRILKGSRINLSGSSGFKPSAVVEKALKDKTIVGEDGVLLCDIEFSSLSTAACFVTGRTANGMITWKTDDGKYVRYTLKSGK